VLPVPPLKSPGKDQEIYLSILIIIVLVLLLFVAACIWNKYRSRNRNRTPDPPLAIQETTQPNRGVAIVYGAIGAAALLANNPVGQRDTSKGLITVS